MPELVPAADICTGTVVRSWDELVAEGRQAIDGYQWKLGDLADEVETAYGEASLAAYAAEISVNCSTLMVYRSVARAYPEPFIRIKISFGAAQVLAAQPDRLELAASQKWTVAQARELVTDRRTPALPVSGSQPPEPDLVAAGDAFDWPEPTADDDAGDGMPGGWQQQPAQPAYPPPAFTSSAPSPPATPPAPPPGAHVSHNSGDNEWYTPADYTKAARAVMGDIDLDPASSEIANSVVSAYRFFTEADDGLSKEWAGRVWMNPPYAQPFIAQFAARLVESFANGNVTEACVLVNNATETAWFSGMLMQASAVCFPRGRIRFWHPSKESAPLQGQAILYLGPNADAFTAEFAQFGPTSPWGAR